ncbi:DUF2793 domain-containing protein [Planktomarina temperata]|uniref:DUF2793 domain-containing protein n=2 Tax=Planktomarina TaxID=1284657 RepID=A0AAN0VJS5_9RHOB|nr:hypothetical protein RCA23_c31000 [Planktomarina temperata RCA23]
MSTVSPNLSLPYIQQNQSQKHVTHNEGMRLLDGVVQLSVLSRAQTAPPANPVAGDRYILPSGATGAWAGFDDSLAHWEENAWRIIPPNEGWVAWDQNGLALLVFSQGQWTEATAADVERLDKLGLNTSADLTNRLAVSSDATLLTHDTTGGHQLKINKDQPGDTGSLLFQTGWSGRAEMGLAGSDNFEIKVSPDGSNFHQALTVDRATGAVTLPNTTLSQAEFGTSPIVTVDYTNSKTGNLVSNGNGALGNSYNMPSALSYDASDTPGLPGSFLFTGYHGLDLTTSEFIAVDAQKTYRLESYIKQATGDRHAQVMGIMAFDADFQQITSACHMRYASGGVDSLTTLSAPLAPGDTTVSVTNASGWNDADSSSDKCGLIFFTYRTQGGNAQDFYSRHFRTGLFSPAQVDRTNHSITLLAPLAQSDGNPDDPSGIWPAGTPLANTDSGWNLKPALLDQTVLPTAGYWYHACNHIGGVDTSGRNEVKNFPPSTAFVKILMLPNFSNRPGGYSGFADSGAAHGLHLSGISMAPEPYAAMQATASGGVDIKVPDPDFTTGSLSLITSSLRLKAV